MPAGAPALFKTVIELENKIKEYFVFIQGSFHLETITPKEGEPYKQKIWDREPEFPTITGLALYLGFCSRQSFYDYEKEEEFSYTIKKARLTIEANYEQGLHRQSPTGAIFALKNFGWKDKQEIEQRATIEDQRIDESKLTDDELRTLAEIQRKSGTRQA